MKELVFTFTSGDSKRRTIRLRENFDADITPATANEFAEGLVKANITSRDGVEQFNSIFSARIVTTDTQWLIAPVQATGEPVE